MSDEVCSKCQRPLKDFSGWFKIDGESVCLDCTCEYIERYRSFEDSQGGQ